MPELDACCEILWVKIFTRGNTHAHICAYYRPIVADEASLLSFEFATSLRRASEAHNPTLLIAGDLNFPGWNWPTMILKPDARYPRLHQSFVDLTLA